MTDTRRASRDTSQSYEGDRATRVTGERAPTVRSELLHYNKQYGTTITDSQYEGLEDNRKAFESGVLESRENIAGFQGEKDAAQSSLNYSVKQTESKRKEAQAQLDAAKAKETTWANARQGSNYSKIHVWNGWNEEATYYLPKEYVSQIGDYWKSNGVESGAWGSTGDIWMNAGSKEVHQSLGDKEREYDAMYTNAVATARKDRIDAQIELDNTISSWNSTVAENQGQLNLAQVNLDSSSNQLTAMETERSTTLSGIKKSYSDRLSRIRETVQAMGQGGGE